MKTTCTTFGKMADGRSADLFTLTSPSGLIAKVTSYGATLTELHTPDHSGKMADVVLGFPTLAGYLAKHPHLGTTVGRVANRIAGGRFYLDDIAYKLTANDGPNTIHGGPQGFGSRLWNAEICDNQHGCGVTFSYFSPDMEEGFPGNVQARVIYRLVERDLIIEFHATTDKTTPINMTNHAYFNLRGAGQGDVLGHEVFIAADFYTPSDTTLLPTGEILRVQGTPVDFTKPATIGSRIAQVAPGYDHNFVVRPQPHHLRLAARVKEPQTGRVMEVRTTQPGIQFYTGNFLDGTVRGIGGPYLKHYGFCLETQHFADAVHHSHFPSILVHPERAYHETAVYRFLSGEEGLQQK